MEKKTVRSEVTAVLHRLLGGYVGLVLENKLFICKIILKPVESPMVWTHYAVR